MKYTTQANGLHYLVGEYTTIRESLWWQLEGLSYNATGYGSKIPTRNKILIGNKFYRIYTRIYSNAGTCYIVSKGIQIIVSDSNFKGD